MRRLWWGFLRFFFRLLYNECAWSYDAVAWAASLGHWQAWGRTTIPYLQGKAVLEIGHGPGHLLAAMKDAGLKPVGLDLSPQMGRLARSRLRRAGAAFPLVRARAQRLPFRDGCFDSTVATFPTEYILNPATWQEVARVLRSSDGSDATASTPPQGGRMVIAAWTRLTRRGLLPLVLAWLYRVTGQGEPAPGPDGLAAVDPWFTPQVVWQPVGPSQVMLVIADKRVEPAKQARRRGTEAGSGTPGRTAVNAF